jgi:tetratricopeptide (TPR) repeat protein
MQGDYAQAQEHYRSALALLSQVEDDGSRAYVETHLGLLLTDLEETEEAGIHLYSALAQRSSQVSQAAGMDTEAALALLDMARGDSEFAIERARDTVAWLAAHGHAGVELPLQVYWHCYAIFKMNGLIDEANRTLTEAHDLLQSLAHQIKDPERRRGFLDNVPYHRQIVAAWDAT